MLELIRIELFKIFRKPRTFIAFFAITAIVGLIQMGFYVDGESYINFGMQALSDSFDVDGKILNGYLLAYIILQTLLVHVPLLIALVSGDMISGEANMGTLRLLITKPVSRAKLVSAKFLASSVYTLLLLIWMAVWALFVSMLIFGTDDMIIMKSEVVTQIIEKDVVWRYVAAFGFAALAMVTVSSLAFFLSIFAENSIGPIIACMSIVIVFTILNTLNLPIFNTVKPYLFTSHMLGWKGFFDVKVNVDNEQIVGSVENLPAVMRSAAILFLHIIGFWIASIVVFRRKDIMS
ncbi:MAG TPA: ABC transporter permease subunit [Chitinophagaceae bacterium]|jgi:ABC-2 type transport system permease protein|nr:ABC transporter permease subunit [Chitinophagaceae bacterium]